MGLFEGVAQGLELLAVLFLEFGDLAGQGDDEGALAVRRRVCGWVGRAWARRCSMRRRRSGWL